MQFVPYPKTPRLKRSVVITEKIDGTNAQIVISQWGYTQGDDDRTNVVAIRGDRMMRVGSRSRWITPGKDTDNFGFAAWCVANEEELFKLGVGQHFGEWYGAGIQRGYGLDHKRFALFNTARWGQGSVNTPACCEAVPILPFQDADDANQFLKDSGSIAVPGFMQPEGVIVYHSAAKQVFKVLIEADEVSKSEAGIA
ncbi:hypothetical protein GNX71_18425 [Variovorax sp. RKNM96]|uniref:RNA ligase family protein n=1 Tax=Variovorax sp. RKNM96 TaxID=2681552 RepID=UPI00197EEBF5|nr:RNA ligase family protein [Variovorax sp. RKNM96]QSI31446.1 hypothetical protein GNX71_18425 [Variovorax sp. RKNM96]